LSGKGKEGPATQGKNKTFDTERTTTQELGVAQTGTVLVKKKLIQ